MAANKKIKAWDVCPWPSKGDNSSQDIYIAVGRALTTWEEFEGFLSLLFAELVGSRNTQAARQAYCAVRTFEGRSEMLKAASSAYFHDFPNNDFRKNILDLIKEAKNLAPRRNEIAHGIVRDFYELPHPDIPPFRTGQYALFPTYADSKKRDVNTNPSYCYTSVELNHYTEQFIKLCGKVGFIQGMFSRKYPEEN